MTVAIVTLIGSIFAQPSIDAQIFGGTVPDGIAVGTIEEATWTGQTGARFVAETTTKVVVAIWRIACSTAFTFFAHKANWTFAMICFVGLFDAWRWKVLLLLRNVTNKGL